MNGHCAQHCASDCPAFGEDGRQGDGRQWHASKPIEARFTRLWWPDKGTCPLCEVAATEREQIASYVRREGEGSDPDGSLWMDDLADRIARGEA